MFFQFIKACICRVFSTAFARFDFRSVSDDDMTMTIWRYDDDDDEKDVWFYRRSRETAEKKNSRLYPLKSKEHIHIHARYTDCRTSSFTCEVVHGLPGMGWTLVNKCHTFFTSWLCPANRFGLANIHHTIHSALSSGFLRLSDLAGAV